MMHIAEDVRMQELLATEILDTPRNARFDEILDQLCDELDCSYARLSFIDKERIWIKSKRGISIQEFPRAASIEEIILNRWCDEDIISRAQERHIRISKKVARRLLAEMDHRFDAEQGINWDVIDYYIDSRND